MPPQARIGLNERRIIKVERKIKAQALYSFTYLDRRSLRLELFHLNERQLLQDQIIQDLLLELTLFTRIS